MIKNFSAVVALSCLGISVVCAFIVYFDLQDSTFSAYPVIGTVLPFFFGLGYLLFPGPKVRHGTWEVSFSNHFFASSKIVQIIRILSIVLGIISSNFLIDVLQGKDIAWSDFIGYTFVLTFVCYFCRNQIRYFFRNRW